MAPGDDELATDDGVTAGDEDDSGTEVVIEIVKLVEVVLPSVWVVMVEISVVVTRVEVKVTGGITTVVGGGTETTVVVNEEDDSVYFEESVGFFLPPSSLPLSELVRAISKTRRYSVPT